MLLSTSFEILVSNPVDENTVRGYLFLLLVFRSVYRRNWIFAWGEGRVPHRMPWWGVAHRMKGRDRKKLR